MALPKHHRLSSSKSITSLVRLRPAAADDFFLVRVVRNTTRQRVFAVSVPVKVARTAARRNAIKRTISEVLRSILPKTSPGFQCLVTVRVPELPTHTEVASHLLALLQKSAIVSS